MDMQLDQTILPLGDLLDALKAQGFQPGLEARFRLRRWMDRLALMDQPLASDTLKYQLSALLAVSAEAQDLFYQIYDQWAAPFWQIDESAEPLSGSTNDEEQKEQQEELVNEEDTTPKDAGNLTDDTPPPPSDTEEPPPPLPTSGRSGPIRIELLFPDDGLRIWNTPEMDQALQPLREKEWTLVREWDMTASIRRTIRAGGIPHFVHRYRKKAPQYLVLIDQKSPRDHLAGLYADLVRELNRRDLDAEYYFYDTIPYRCWRDPRDLHTHTHIEGLQSSFPGAKLLLIGDVEGLLDFPNLRPSNLLINLLENWQQTALLTPKSTADWAEAERVLCSLLPISPATATGLATLLRQWNASVHYTPEYWQLNFPEPALPGAVEEEDPDALDAYLENLYYYLGENGFQWLCAAAVYPEIYWELTKLLHDESIPPDGAISELDQNLVWQIALRRLSRIPWFRQGNLSQKVREYIREQFETQLPALQRAAIRDQLLKVLNINESRFPVGSFADANRTFTIAWYEYQRAIAAPGLSEPEKARIEAEFREKGLAKINLSEIEDSLGRRLFAEIQERMLWPPVPDKSGFYVLWVDDEYEKNLSLQDKMASSMPLKIVNARHTDEALSQLAKHGFHLIISDIRRSDSPVGGIEMFELFKERRVPTPVVFYTTPKNLANYREDLLELGAEEVLTGKGRIQAHLAQKTDGFFFRVLWVDDKPLNNAAFQEYIGDSLPVIFTNVNTTEEAVTRLQHEPFDAVFSDIGRQDSRRAGVEMLETFKRTGIQVPVLFCTTQANVEELRDELLRLGAEDVCDRNEQIEHYLRSVMSAKQSRKALDDFRANRPPAGEQAQSTAETFDTSDAKVWLDEYLNATRELLEADEIQGALAATNWLDAYLDLGYREDLLLQQGQLRQILRSEDNKSIENPAFLARIRLGLSSIIVDIPKRFELNTRLGKARSLPALQVNTGALEKTLGLDAAGKITWLQKAAEVQSALCRVVTPNGNEGTGFLTAGGYLFTAYHVLRTMEEAGSARAEFPDAAYQLDPAGGFISSENLGFVRVKLKNHDDRPLENRTFLEWALQHAPERGEDLIVTQMSGWQKTTAVTSLHKTITFRDQYLFYGQSTRPGSSGAPVFNTDWHIVALHQGEDTVINARGDRQGANRGILSSDIIRYLNQAPAPSTPSPDAPPSKACLLYNIPSRLEVGASARCTVRFASSAKILQKNWKTGPDDVLVDVPLPDIGAIAVDLMEVPQNESDDDIFNISKRTNFNVRYDQPNKYLQWFFDIEALAPGDSTLSIHFEYTRLKNQAGEHDTETVVVPVTISVKEIAAPKKEEAPDYEAERAENDWLKNDPYEAVAMEEQQKASPVQPNKSAIIAAARNDIAHDRIEQALQNIQDFAAQSKSEWSGHYIGRVKQLRKQWETLQKQFFESYNSRSWDEYSSIADQVRKEILDLLASIELNQKPEQVTNYASKTSKPEKTEPPPVDTPKSVTFEILELLNSGQVENALTLLIDHYQSMPDAPPVYLQTARIIQADYYQNKADILKGTISSERARLNELQTIRSVKELLLQQEQPAAMPTSAAPGFLSRIRKLFTGK
ncbi:MAG TPA: response regulator [Saprospiraceae bacterium]|nr:response regulator [Saprospiraceae bacterium]